MSWPSMPTRADERGQIMSTRYMTADAPEIQAGYDAARETYGADYALYLIEHDAELLANGHAIAPWPLSLAGNDGE